MNPTLFQISKRKRNIFIIVLLFSLAANFFVLGAGISFFIQGQPTDNTEKIKSVEKKEQEILILKAQKNLFHLKQQVKMDTLFQKV